MVTTSEPSASTCISCVQGEATVHDRVYWWRVDKAVCCMCLSCRGWAYRPTMLVTLKSNGRVFSTIINTSPGFPTTQSTSGRFFPFRLLASNGEKMNGLFVEAAGVSLGAGGTKPSILIGFRRSTNSIRCTDLTEGKFSRGSGEQSAVEV